MNSHTSAEYPLHSRCSANSCFEPPPGGWSLFVRMGTQSRQPGEAVRQPCDCQAALCGLGGPVAQRTHRDKSRGFHWMLRKPLHECAHSHAFQSSPTLHNPVDCSPPGCLSMEFSRQEYWSGWPFLSPGDLPNRGSNLHLSYVSCIGRQVLYHCPTWEAQGSL